ncbi:putative RCC1 domain-containing protein 1 [Daphnia magna]|uniref:Putative RCC1 domain-containing protein 1 n=1 Tax=Daphnia magna TaxID=35525 RepID=A0A164QJE0_9CRUS|nr:putative RCC1 domain-containing protein 1 [Daphnia magna]
MKLFYCGFNGFGQVEHLGANECSSQKIGTCLPMLIYQSETDRVLHVFLGWSRLIITTTNDSVVSGYWNEISSFKGSISEGVSIKQVTCNEHLAVCIDESGVLKKRIIDNHRAQSSDWEKVPTVADEAGPVKFVKVLSNEHSVIALDEIGNIHLPPLRMENMQSKFVDIACGKEHFMTLTNDGNVYSWGSGSRGQLGHGSVESSEYPQEIEMLGGIKIVQIAAGGWHSCALSESGDVYVWGWNESGQLGLPCRNLSDSYCKSNECVSIQSEPRLLDHAMPFSLDEVYVTSIACGARHTAVTLDDKSGWSWGWNGCGQLGTGDRRSHDAPVCVIQDVEKVMCGAWSTAWLSNY